MYTRIIFLQLENGNFSCAFEDCFKSETLLSIGQAVTNNLLRKGFNVTAITDIKPELCQGFPSSIQVRSSQEGVFNPGKNGPLGAPM